MQLAENLLIHAYEKQQRENCLKAGFNLWKKAWRLYLEDKRWRQQELQEQLRTNLQSVAMSSKAGDQGAETNEALSNVSISIKVII